MLYYTVLHHAKICCAMLCNDTPYFSMLCCAAICYTLIEYVVIGYTIL